MGAVFSQRDSVNQKLHLCAFFSWLTLAEQNYDVCNREILAVVLALQEWRHWLERSAQLFVDGQTTRTLPISGVRSGLTPGKHVGLFSWGGTASLSPTGLDPETLNWMPCHASSISIPPVLRSEGHPASLLHCGHSYLVSGGEDVGGAAVPPQSHRCLSQPAVCP